MRIVKFLLVGVCITAVSVSFADSKAGTSDTKMVKQQPTSSFTVSKTYTCPGIAPITVQSMPTNSKVYAAIAAHLNTMTKMPSEYKCTFKSTNSYSQSERTNLSIGTGSLILQNPSVVGNEKSGFILMADKLTQDSTYTGKGTGPQFESSSTGKNHMEIGKFNSLKTQQIF